MHIRRPTAIGITVTVAFAVFLARSAGEAGLFAQEGHPLTGTWSGDWQPPGGPPTHLTLVMSWDGKAVTGLVNPGPEAIGLTRVLVDWPTWTVHIEGERKGGDAKPAAITADGRLEDIGSQRRRIVGTWRQDDAAGELRLVRE